MCDGVLGKGSFVVPTKILIFFERSRLQRKGRRNMGKRAFYKIVIKKENRYINIMRVQMLKIFSELLKLRGSKGRKTEKE